MGWGEETGQVQAGIGPFLERRMRERQAYVARQTFPTRGDKSVRAQSICGRMALDGLHLPRLAPWRHAFEAELLTFPAGKHDDQVDALGLVGQLLDRWWRARLRSRTRASRGMATGAGSMRIAKTSRPAGRSLDGWVEFAWVRHSGNKGRERRETRCRRAASAAETSPRAERRRPAGSVMTGCAASPCPSPT